MNKILFLMGRYYPKASPNSICVQNIIDKLSSEGNQIYILCYDDGMTDDKYGNNVTKVSRGWLHSVMYKNEDKHGKAALKKRKILHLVLMLRQIMTYFIWPWMDPLFTWREYLAAKKIVNTENIDIVIAVHFPLSSLIVGHQLKKEYPKLKYYCYFLDSLSGGSVPKLMSRKQYSKQSEKWEKIVTENADNIIFMESSREYHTQLYKESIIDKKIKYLDLPMIKEYEMNEKDDTQIIDFVYVGSLASSIRSPEFFLKVFLKCKEENWRLTFVGDDTCNIVNEAANKDSRIRVVGRCSHKEALEYERQADILVNFGNNNPYLTPSKIFEYMSWRKKIVSTFPIENESSISYLRKYPQALLLDENSTSISNTIHEIEMFVQMEKEHIEYQELVRLFKGNTPEAFIDILNI